ncbi:TetR family transcriptional regulator [Herbidospora sp. NEAU-GS84]|uniref:TetR family transcriptional regulator n=1 Tax=Herbidospora solisilvae TaxID=2696284 RepID=A0A7C9J6Z1_9ACTN|nr:helix-turn-helix domain-containing protein [Herbidospora solisilvae]NAS26342.1 TetR family transcriptional regulator [Herbidospora solisilvae]
MNQKRRYVSGVRQENARATRERIAAAARTLMLERGYAATTMADVARAAGVVVQTLYTSSPGGKPGLAKLVWDVTLAGDAEPVPQSERPQVRVIIAEPDPEKKLAAYAAMAVEIYERVGPVHRVLRAAAATDAGLADLLATTERQRLTGGHGPAAHLKEVGALRDGLTVEEAAAHIYALTSLEVFEHLTEIAGWTPERCRDWLSRVLRDTLLA